MAFIRQEPGKYSWWWCRKLQIAFEWDGEECGMIVDGEGYDDIEHHAECVSMTLGPKGNEFARNLADINLLGRKAFLVAMSADFIETEG